MADPVETGARAAARRLQTPERPELAEDVEMALYARDAPDQPRQYGDFDALASLIVSVATLAWTVYNDIRSRAAAPPPEVVGRRVRHELGRADDPGAALDPATRDRVIEVTVEETVDAAGVESPDTADTAE